MALNLNVASMGPRSDERGNTTRNLAFARKRFFASMGPRSDERGNYASWRCLGCQWKLQWGRARMSAEIGKWEMGIISYEVALQWGRARMSAEIPQLPRLRFPRLPLQWGRARMSAEIRDCRESCECRACRFNGA